MVQGAQTLETETMERYNLPTGSTCVNRHRKQDLFAEGSCPGYRDRLQQLDYENYDGHEMHLAGIMEDSVKNLVGYCLINIETT